MYKFEVGKRYWPEAADAEASADAVTPGEPETPDATQEAPSGPLAPEWDYVLDCRYCLFRHTSGNFSNEYETDDLREARQALDDEWGAGEITDFAIFDRDARQYIQIRATPKGRKAFKKENERLRAKAAKPEAQAEPEAEPKKLYELEMTRNNVTPRVFYGMVRRALLEKGGVELESWVGPDEWMNPPTVCDAHSTENETICKKPFDFHIAYVDVFNVILKFQFCDENRGTGYAYICEYSPGEDVQAPDADDVRERKPQAGNAPRHVVVKRGIMPDGTAIQIEDWSRVYTDTFRDASTLAAYPVAKWSLPGEFSPKAGEAFVALESGATTLEDYVPSCDDYTEPDTTERPHLWDPHTLPALTGRAL